jgi:hypothetical protein
MKVQKFNISKPKKYFDRDGNEKTQWNNIGYITEFHKDDGSVNRILEIPAIGLEASIFPQNDQEQVQGQRQQRPAQTPQQRQKVQDDYGTIDYPEEDINPDDIPF